MMAGKPYKVGRFAHTLRVRLMREHLGIDVDALYEEELMANDPVEPIYDQKPWDPDSEQQLGKEEGVTRVTKTSATANLARSVRDGLGQGIFSPHFVLCMCLSLNDSLVGQATEEATSRATGHMLRKIGIKNTKVVEGLAIGEKELAEERKMYARDGEKIDGFASSVVPTLEEKIVHEQMTAKGETEAPKEASEAVPSNSTANGKAVETEDGQARTQDKTELFGAPADASENPQTDDQPPHARSGVDDATEEERAAPEARTLLRKHLASKFGNKKWTLPVPAPNVDANGFEDPIADSFWKDVWVACAVHNVSKAADLIMEIS
jgi:phospholipase D1/2